MFLKFLDNQRICPWWLTYSFDNPLRHLIHKPEKILASLVKPGMTAMDIGCGFGFFSIAMARMVGVSGTVIAEDVQEESLKVALKRARQAHLANIVKPHLGTIERINYPGQVDFILSFWMAHEVKDQPSFFKEISSLLKPGGKYLLVEPVIHVTATDFAVTVGNATANGLNPVADHKVAMSRAKLFTN
jgi:ubiquinone/menaquinone biosynthesis C-methylase UbiE